MDYWRGFGLVMVLATVSGAQAETFKWSGDFRFRHEYTKKEEDKAANQRERFRLRAKLEATVNEEIQAVAQVASGDGKATTTNQTMDDGFNKKPIYIDLAYFDYTPESRFHVLGGKVKNTFYSPGTSDIVWDGDLTLEGLAGTGTFTVKNHNLFANAGIYSFSDRSDINADTADTMLYALQGGVRCDLSQDRKVTASLGHYQYTSLKGKPNGGFANGNTQTGVNYTHDYEIVDIGANFEMPLQGRALNIYLNIVANMATSAERDGFLFGAKWGAVKEKKDWMLAYDYRQVRKDAVLGAVSESDVADGQTNSRAHRVQVAYGLAANTQAGFTYSRAERFISATPTMPSSKGYDRAQLDFAVKF